MTDTDKHFSPFHDPNAESLAGALAKFEALADETPSRKARARAAVATFGRLLHKPADAIPAQGRYMKERFAQLKHRPTGLSAKSVANCKTELRYLVTRVCAPGTRSEFRPLAPAWVVFRETIVDERCIWKLSRLMAFASAADIAPCAVDDALIERFRAALHELDDVTKPDQHVRQAIRTWNRIAAVAPEQGLSLLSLAAKRIPRWTIEPARFPASFRQDVAAWLAVLSTVDPEGEEGPVRALRPQSLKLREHQVFKAASALVFTGRPIETVASLADLVDIDAYKAIMKHLRERQGGAMSIQLHSVATGLKFVAKHQVRVDDGTLQRMNRICANYKNELRDHESKNHTRLMSFDDEKLLGALLHLPARLLEEASRPSTSPARRKQLAQLAVAVEIETQAPLRLANLAALHLSDNIQRVTVGGEIHWIVRFGRHETKNRSLLAYKLDGDSVRLIERALRLYPHVDWLFPGAKGTHKRPGTLGVQISREISRRLGRPFNTHMFRGLVASLQTRESNNGFEVGRAMLGDRSDRVVRAHYTTTAERRLIEQGQETIRRVRIRTAPLVAKR